MALPLTELAAAVMTELGILGDGQSPSAGDSALVSRAYLQWLRTAQNRQIVDWYSETDEIPDGAEHGTTLCVCNQLYRAFGVDRDPSWLLEGEMALSDYMHNHVASQQTPMVNM